MLLKKKAGSLDFNSSKKLPSKDLKDTEFIQSKHCWLEALDITEADQREALIKKIDQKLGGVDVLINNAGKSYRAVVEHITEKERMAQMEINFQIPYGTHKAMPALHAKKQWEPSSIYQASVACCPCPPWPFIAPLKEP